MISETRVEYSDSAKTVQVTVNMVNSSVKVFARLKKETDSSKVGAYEVISKKEGYDDIAFLKFRYKGDLPRWYRFHKIFNQDSQQSELFQVVAKPVINSVLDGFNGTIFAYGQTGSGKTYTITGSPKTYNDRGIIPRSLQYIFEKSNEANVKPSIYISYMEIYNEIGYDLLSEKQTNAAKSLEELPRITLLENGNGEAHIRNLSVLPISAENEAMKLLHQGDTNRTIAETPMNEYSSRSHCIFTIYITFRDKVTQNVRYSKLHLVDLAGSERVCRTLTTGVALGEAKYINLSLHYLQQVIMALTEQNRTHVPYRNSMMTYILRDSLCGNCLTTMLATLAVTQSNIDETISTCKFAQRVSLLVTEPVINEIIDPEQELMFLRDKIEELEHRISILTSFRTSDDLPEEIKHKCKCEVDSYLKDKETKELRVDSDFTQIQFCFNLMKNEFDCQRKSYEDHMAECEKRKAALKKLRQTVTKKEEEINNLKVIIDNIPETPVSLNQSYKSDLRNIQSEPIMKHVPRRKTFDQQIFMNATNPFETIDEDSVSTFTYKNVCLENGVENKHLYEKFLRTENVSTTLNAYKNALEKKLEVAKLCSLAIEQCQKNITYMKKKLEYTHGSEKKCIIHELEEQQNIYKTVLTELKDVRNDTSHLQAGLEQAENQIMEKFRVWLKNYSTPITFQYLVSNRTNQKNWKHGRHEYRNNKSLHRYSDSLSSVDNAYSDPFSSLSSITEMNEDCRMRQCCSSHIGNDMHIFGEKILPRLKNYVYNQNCPNCYEEEVQESCIKCLEEIGTKYNNTDNNRNESNLCQQCIDYNQNMLSEKTCEHTKNTNIDNDNLDQECVSKNNVSSLPKVYCLGSPTKHIEGTVMKFDKQNANYVNSKKTLKHVTIVDKKSKDKQTVPNDLLRNENLVLTHTGSKTLTKNKSTTGSEIQINRAKKIIKNGNNYEEDEFSNSDTDFDSNRPNLASYNSEMSCNDDVANEHCTQVTDFDGNRPNFSRCNSKMSCNDDDANEDCTEVPKQDDINSQFKEALSVAKVESTGMVDCYDYFKETDSQIFKEFMETVTLTGDREVDAQIVEFYRCKFS